MNPRLKSFLLWILAFVITVAAGYYQRTTGPTYEIRGKAVIDGESYKYKLIRTYDGSDDAPIELTISDPEVSGELRLRRYKSYDEWSTTPMVRQGDKLAGTIPHQEMAGKVMYHVTLMKNGKNYLLNEEPAVIRFKGFVPLGVLYAHIITIFLAMLFSTRTAFEVLFKLKYTYLYTWLTVIFLAVGGMILGPVIQKYAFDAYWTGWPFGNDLTDNKSLLAFIFWLVALGYQIWRREKKGWAVAAAVVLFVIYMIPHSVLGSEIDYTKEGQQTEIQE
ncbi:MAG: hypothetical protein ISS17_01010 [Bacteroidales bacterium]|nr:hypothetical protein [Bacteroidales bacterium]